MKYIIAITLLFTGLSVASEQTSPLTTEATKVEKEDLLSWTMADLVTMAGAIASSDILKEMKAQNARDKASLREDISRLRKIYNEKLAEQQRALGASATANQSGVKTRNQELTTLEGRIREAQGDLAKTSKRKISLRKIRHGVHGAGALALIHFMSGSKSSNSLDSSTNPSNESLALEIETTAAPASH